MKTFIPSESIERKIFLIRGQKVMLSTHLAELYGIETRVLMQAVRRNSDRFPDDFKFTLTRDEIMRISQIVTSLKFQKRSMHLRSRAGKWCVFLSAASSPNLSERRRAIWRSFIPPGGIRTRFCGDEKTSHTKVTIS